MKFEGVGSLLILVIFVVFIHTIFIELKLLIYGDVTIKKGFFVDNETDVMWEIKTNSNSGMEYDSHNARYYCKNLNIGGFSDWRLPITDEINELNSNEKMDIFQKYGNWDNYYKYGASKLFPIDLHSDNFTVSDLFNEKLLAICVRKK